MFMKRGSKKAQFYLIAAVIIIAIIAGFIFYKNYATTNKENTIIYNVGKELKLETGSVYDYGTYNKKVTSELIANWSKQYYNYAKTQSAAEDWIFVYGDSNGMTAIAFSMVNAGSVSIDTGSGAVSINVLLTTPVPTSVATTSGSKTIKIIFKGIEYPFTLEEGQNFFFVIKGGTSATSAAE